MRLNSLTLFGFKSFPARTKLSFTKGVIGIVGPNGCGKSNIVDAIRWVLGEQSPSMLRAKRMDDILYNGNNDGQTGLAEVRLVVENEGSFPPPGYENTPEIEIMRRIHKSGDTEYRINGKTCRLKDIHYLFMDTGVGTRAYSILDQGQVSAFIDMVPQDRRFLIEEVAGISRFRARRSEAERRMVQTKQNLERLEDLLVEVERQRKFLSRQAKRTRRYLKLRREQDQLDQALIAHVWFAESGRRTDLEKERDNLSADLSGVQAELSKNVADRERLELEVLEAEEALAVIRKGLADAEDSLQELREEASQHDKSLIKEENRLQSAEKTLMELDEKGAWIERGRERLKKDIETLKTEESSYLVEISDRENGIEESKAIRDQVRESLEAVKVELVDAAARHARLDSKRNGLKDRKDRLRHRLDQRRNELQGISGHVKDLEGDLKGQQEKVEETRAELDSLSHDGKALESAVSHLRSRLSATVGKRHEADSELASCRARLNALKTIDASGEGFSRATNKLLGSDVPTLGVLADFLEVEPGWEHLVEIALGHGIQALVVPDMEACDKAISFLKDQPSGRASLIIPGKEHSKAEETGDNTLLEFVRAGHPVNKVVADILVHWKVVPDLKTAFNIRNTDNKALFYITSDGEILTPWGELVFGDKDKASSGILARKAEVSGLTVRENELHESSMQIRIEEDEISKGLSEAETGLKEVNEKKGRISEDLAGHKKERDSLLREIEAERERSQRIDLEIEEAEEEILDVEVSLEGLEEAIEVAVSARIEAEGHIKGREDALRQQEQVLARRRKVLEEYRIKMARVQTQLQEREQELGRLADRKNQVSRDREMMLAEKQDLAVRLEDRTGSLKDVRVKVETKENEVLIEKRHLEKAETEYDKTRQAVAGLQGKVNDLQTRLRDIEEQVHQNELVLSEVEQALVYLKKTAWDHHQANIEEFCDKWRISPFSPDEAKDRISEIARKIDRIGSVNLAAVEEYRELEDRWDYLNSQKDDLISSIEDLEQAISRINRTCRTRFKEALDSVNESLSRVFPLLFEGGSAKLKLTSSDDILNSGIDYLIQLPGKRIQYLNLLSGGEKVLAAMALILAIYFIKPGPFCLLDEVDAALDEANTVRFNRFIKKISEQSQVVLVTHNQKVMEIADVLFGVTMEDKGVSRLVSVDLVENPGI
ncbi:MAG: chromosome segregation protein SMC [Deltaproteobacteria bacterium]|nr:chromosome segregation protein SMC [Deltaproteobacteria bacterium]